MGKEGEREEVVGKGEIERERGRGGDS